MPALGQLDRSAPSDLIRLDPLTDADGGVTRADRNRATALRPNQLETVGPGGRAQTVASDQIKRLGRSPLTAWVHAGRARRRQLISPSLTITFHLDPDELQISAHLSRAGTTFPRSRELDGRTRRDQPSVGPSDRGPRTDLSATSREPTRDKLGVVPNGHLTHPVFRMGT
jgi:hypothetical protein